MPLLFLILSSCASRPSIQQQYEAINNGYREQRAALLERQGAEYLTALRQVRTMSPEQIRAVSSAMRERHAAEQKALFEQWNGYLAQSLPAQQPAQTNGLFAAGMALSGAAAGAGYYATPPAFAPMQPMQPFPLQSPSRGAVIMQPGQYPTYLYNNGSSMTLMQPGKMPTYVYPY